ncbi:MAG TPA: R3H domain-containing nucleic acid-binding protein [Coleofasciculaceae cyanobacterium]
MVDQQLVQRGKEWLESLMTLVGLPAQVGVDGEKLETEGSYWLTIDDSNLSPEQVQAVLGAEGTVLDAIQYLANTTLNLGQPEEAQKAYTIELAGYRVRRQAELQSMADQAAQQVRETGEVFEMAGLSAAERRQVHTYLKSFDDLETESRGREPDRRLVVKLAASEP